MQTYRFTFSLADDPRSTEEWCDAIYEAGGDDSTPGVGTEGPAVHFAREAATLDEALRSAAAVVRKAGLTITRCEIGAADFADVVGAA